MENALDRPAMSFANHQFVIIDGQSNVASAVEAMQAKSSDTIIVIHRGAPVGIVTDSDILDKVVTAGGDSDRIILRSIMTSPVITAGRKATVREVLRLMRFYKIKRVPVIEGENVLGVVTQRALADSVRTSVLERTFSKYRTAFREQVRVLIGNMGLVVQFAGILMVVPALLGAFIGEPASAAGIFLTVFGLFATGFVLNNYGERGPLNIKQASILVVSSFILLGFFGSIPYMYVNPFGRGIALDALLVNSFFESISGFTTTGLSMIAEPEKMEDTMVFYHSYTQWVGGLSFIYLVMMLFYPERKLNAMKGMLGGGMLRFRQLLITICVIFTTYTAALVLLVYATGGTNPIYDVAMAMSAVTGGGFAPSSTFFSPSNPLHLVLAGIGLIISALPFAFHYSVFSKALRRQEIITEVLIYASLMGLAFMIFLALSGVGPLASAFHVVSASTNGGFQFIDARALPAAAKVVLIVLMMIGGTAFSTAGGVKVGRLLLIYQHLTKRKMTDTAASVSTPVVEKAFRESIIVIVSFVIVALGSGAVIASFEEARMEDAVFEATSALTTTGLSTGIIAVDSDIPSKLLLTGVMVAGRFEIIAILYIFFSWLRR